jgi:tetratricopeptide (TPR) repeat protein
LEAARVVGGDNKYSKGTPILRPGDLIDLRNWILQDLRGGHAAMTQPPDHGKHPDPILLERFMRNEVETAERRWIVRHLIAGCSRCVAVTSRLWSLGDPPAEAAPLATAAGARSKGPGARRSLARGPAAEPAEAYGDLFERLADVGRRIEEEREQAPRLAAELLASSPAARAALLARLDAVRSVGSPGSRPGGRRPAVLTPAVCEVLLDRSRDAAAGEPAVALQAADLALAIAERLDPVACGGTVARGLRVRAWAHLAQARRLGDDLDGAEWALAVAEALASGIGGRAAAAPAAAAATGAGASGAPGAHRSDTAVGGPGLHDGTGAGAVPLEPAEWAELLVFKAGLFADRGDLRGADRLLGRAAELFHAGAEPRRAGRTLVQEGLIRAELGDRERAAELLRAGVDLLDPAAEPALVAANLYRLATLLRGIAMEATAAAAATPGAQTARTAEAREPRGAGDSPPAPLTASAHDCGVEALQLVERARVLYRELGDAAAEAYLSRLQGQIEAALGKLEDAAATLLAATAALAQQGLGREAALAQIELALVLLRQGRAAEVRRLGLDLRPVKQARDKSWPWAAALLVFQVTANEPSHLAHPGEIMLLGELARFLASRPQHAPQQPHGRRRHRLERVA